VKRYGANYTSFRILICKMTRLLPRSLLQHTFSVDRTVTVTEEEAHLLKPFNVVVVLWLAVGSSSDVFVQIFSVHTERFICNTPSYFHIIDLFFLSIVSRCDHIHCSSVVELTSFNT
jgi:hypothetical protein